MASGKYDMDLLREISRTEEEALRDLVHMYEVRSASSVSSLC